MKVVAYGSCQLARIYETYLQHCDYFKEANYSYYPYFELARQQRDLPIEDLQSADIFFYQPMSSTYGIYSTENGKEGVLQYIPESAIKISIPFFYLDIYPLHVYFDKIKCGNALEKYKTSMGSDDILQQYETFTLDFELQRRAKNSIDHIRKKEEWCTIHYSEFIETYYKTVKLASLWCHPTVPVYRYIMNQIYSYLQIPFHLDIFQEPFEFVHGESEPESNYMKQELGLEYPLNINKTLYQKFICQYLQQ